MELHSANLHQHAVSQHLHKGWSLPAARIKNLIAYTAVALLLLSSIIYFYPGIAERLPALTAPYYFAVTYIVLGVVQVFGVKRWLPQFDPVKGFIYTVLLAVAASLIFVMLFMFLQFHGGLLPMAAASAFILPFAINLCWFYFSSLGIDRYPVWFLPKNNVPETRMSLLLNSLAFTISIKVRETDGQFANFNVTLSPKLSIGAMFSRFLYDHQEITIASNQLMQDVGWRFYVRKWYGVKNLDPQLNLTANGIREDDVIVAERA